MQTEKLLEIKRWAQKELDQCIHFWLTHGIDHIHGGVYTCLDRAGNIYSTDKSVWMQGRCAWLFAHLCNVYGPKKEWMEASKSCLDFLENHCVNRKAGNRMYFTVTAEGHPLRQRRYCFSEGFYVLANAEYYALTKEITCIERARAAYWLIYQLNHGLTMDPVGMGPKTIAATRSMRSLADPMIFLNLTSVMCRCDPENAAQYKIIAEKSADEIIHFHWKPDLKCTLENVGINGAFMKDVTAGRVVNPGHDMECSWFLLEQANAINDTALHETAVQMYDFAYQSGWDQEYGGLLYFIDCLGLPTEAYEQDMKLWWPHNEALIASMMIYRDTQNEIYLQQFIDIWEYCKKFFSDPLYGEWYGYLRRDGKPTMPPVKGSTFKGPFHLPRSLIMIDTMINHILETSHP